MELIDKAAVVAEIERRKHKLLDSIIRARDKEWVVRTTHQLNRIISFLNTLEVKEVDLEKEIEKYLLTNATLLIGGDSKLVVHHIAKHFFELGLKMKGGEE